MSYTKEFEFSFNRSPNEKEQEWLDREFIPKKLFTEWLFLHLERDVTSDEVYQFKTKHTHGFSYFDIWLLHTRPAYLETQTEIQKLLNDFDITINDAQAILSKLPQRPDDSITTGIELSSRRSSQVRRPVETAVLRRVIKQQTRARIAQLAQELSGLSESDKENSN